MAFTNIFADLAAFFLFLSIAVLVVIDHYRAAEARRGHWDETLWHEEEEDDEMWDTTSLQKSLHSPRESLATKRTHHHNITTERPAPSPPASTMSSFWKQHLLPAIYQVVNFAVVALALGAGAGLYERATEHPFPIPGMGTDDRVLRARLAQRKKKKIEEDKKNKK
ncbi:hypothetical protein BDV97DRAFT_395927 [Delphinella strobiligena]|nr:hypothetical protein BDV97DRAFT_395927 [Delphinella strobiligena]